MRVRFMLAGSLCFLVCCNGQTDDGTESSSSPDGGTAVDGATSSNDDAAQAGSCTSPDFAVILDRTLSMHRRPDGTIPGLAGLAESKWYLAISAVESITDTLGDTVRSGLVLFPRDPGPKSNGVERCVTVEEKIEGATASNQRCESGEVVVEISSSAAPEIEAALDIETTLLCWSTPIGPGLETASAMLDSAREPDREQYAVLITDGNDTCDEELATTSLKRAQNLAADGVKLFVVGFDGSGKGINQKHLNKLACAGRTAVGFPGPCTANGNGDYTATDPGGETLFVAAEDGNGLDAALETIAGDVCCGCDITVE